MGMIIYIVMNKNAPLQYMTWTSISDLYKELQLCMLLIMPPALWGNAFVRNVSRWWNLTSCIGR